MAVHLVAKSDSETAQYHLRQYVVPKIGKPNAARITNSIDNVPSNSLCTLLNHFIYKNKIWVEASFDGTCKKFPISSLHKFTHSTDKISEGFVLENIASNNALQVGIMKKAAAGCAKGADLELIHSSGKLLNVELKKGMSSIGGQMTLYQNENLEWYIPSNREAEFPGYSEVIRNATHGSESFLNAINSRAKLGKNEYISSDLMHVEACLAFQRDKGVDVFHMEGKGTYAVSSFAASMGLPSLSGTVQLRLRRKHKKAVICVDFKNIEKSEVHWNFHELNGVKEIKYGWLSYNQNS